MLRRLALLLSIRPTGDRTSGILRVANADTRQALTVTGGSFLLTLERERDATFARGHLRLLGDGADYPIQSNAALFEALNEYIARAETAP